MKKIYGVLFVLFLFLASLPQAFAQDNNKVALRLYLDKTAAVPGQTLRMAIEQTIMNGWHTYWTNPGDSGEAMSVEWTLPKNYTISDFLWPAPERIAYGPLMNFGYHERAVVLADIKVPQDAEVGQTVSIKGRANVLVCDEICIPETHELSFDVPVAANARDVNADVFTAAAAALPQPMDWMTITEVDANEVRVRVTLPEGAGDLFSKTPEEIIWFPKAWGYIENASDQSAMFEPSTRTLTLRQGRADTRNLADIKEGAYLLSVGNTSVLVSGAVTSMLPPVMGAPKLAIPVTDTSWGLLLIFAFVGGLILNLMPCVFPVLSMKALHLISLKSAERKHAQVSGMLYTAGVVVMFLALGAALLAVRAAGTQLGWGFQLQNPAIVAALSWMLFVIGLNLAGVFDLRIAFGGNLLMVEKHHPHIASFLTGVLATVVATPCSAPFMATALGAALVQPTFVALAIFATVGLGLAFPYILLCFVPALQKILPRPGAWMQTFKQFLAFPMFASCVWLVWVVAQQGGADAVGWTLTGMVALAFAIWLLDIKPKTKKSRRILTALGVLFVVFTAFTIQFIVHPSEGANAENAVVKNYQPFTPKTLEEALRESARPVFVNMTASWCITCLVNEKVTLNTPLIKDLFKTMDVTYLKGDWTNEDPAITEFLEQYGRSGVPLYVYYPSSDEATGERPAAVILPQILTPEMLFEIMQ